MPSSSNGSILVKGLQCIAHHNWAAAAANCGWRPLIFMQSCRAMSSTAQGKGGDGRPESQALGAHTPGVDNAQQSLTQRAAAMIAHTVNDAVKRATAAGKSLAAAHKLKHADDQDPAAVQLPSPLHKLHQASAALNEVRAQQAVSGSGVLL